MLRFLLPGAQVIYQTLGITRPDRVPLYQEGITRVSNIRFRVKLRVMSVFVDVLEEAHVSSHWGADFRMVS